MGTMFKYWAVISTAYVKFILIDRVIFNICVFACSKLLSIYCYIVSISLSGFSAICVTIWGIIMHIIVDLQLLENKDENEDMYSTSTNQTTELGNNTTTHSFLNVSTDPAATADPLKEPPKSHDRCWKGYSNYNLLWIITGPMTLVLLVSLHLSYQLRTFYIYNISYRFYDI